jgi:hypothetical protein
MTSSLIHTLLALVFLAVWAMIGHVALRRRAA